MNILIRTSGGRAPKKELGLGHIYRSVNLAHFLKPNQIFFLVEDFGGSKKIINDFGYGVFLLPKNLDESSDIQKTISLIKRKKIDMVIIDKYNLKFRYVENLFKITKVVVISDLKNINYRCDLLVNGFIGYQNQIKLNKYGTKCLLGPNYQILKQDFAKRKINPRKNYDVLITFGGFDENNITLKVLNVLIKFSSQIKTKIILGPTTKKTKKMESLLKKYPKNLKVISKTNNMYREISKAKFGLCAGGITSYEFAAMSLKFWIICQEKHQLETAREWQKKGLATNLGLGTKITSENIEKMFKFVLENKKKKMIKAGQIVDGLGGKRASNQILKL